MKKHVRTRVFALLLDSFFLIAFPSHASDQDINTELVLFKLHVVEQYQESQWQLLYENNFLGRKEYISAVYSALESYLIDTIRSIENEVILAFDENFRVLFSTEQVNFNLKDLSMLQSEVRDNPHKVVETEFHDADYIAGFYSEEFNIYFVFLYKRQ